mgnify:CR=1 FL=1
MAAFAFINCFCKIAVFPVDCFAFGPGMESEQRRIQLQNHSDLFRVRRQSVRPMNSMDFYLVEQTFYI